MLLEQVINLRKVRKCKGVQIFQSKCKWLVSNTVEEDFQRNIQDCQKNLLIKSQNLPGLYMQNLDA